jgi:peptidoglycan/LPS O-acetylase OafA/YrhL
MLSVALFSINFKERNNMNTRDNSIDILRSIALIGMIIAHCGPGLFFMQIRGFDVPLIVFLSGVSFLISSKKSDKEYSYISYCWKRVKRLAFPTWVFLLLYYSVLFLGLSITGNLKVDWSEILHNFTFITGWYVWIIRVFLIIAILSPLIFNVTKDMNAKTFLILLPILFVGYELLSGVSSSEWYYYLTMTIPYVLFFAIGTMTDKMTNKHFLIVLAVSALVYVVFAWYYYRETGAYQSTQICKYPPRLYYTSYALAFVCVLWVFRKQIASLFERARISSVFCFIGSHTLWIYFWHIILLLLLGQRINNPLLLFAVVFLVAVGLDYIQVVIIKRIMKMIESNSLKKNLTTLFLG